MCVMQHLARVGASACQMSTLKNKTLLEGGGVFLAIDAKNGTVSKNIVFLLANFNSCISVSSPS